MNGVGYEYADVPVDTSIEVVIREFFPRQEGASPERKTSDLPPPEAGRN